MAKIVVFDSGFGSLSIIKPIQKKFKADIIYFADQKNFPYGTKSTTKLKMIIESTIVLLKKQFDPDLIIVGSNTPSLLLRKILRKSKIIGVFPPLKEAVKNTKSNSIAVLATKSVVKNNTVENYIKKNVPKRIKVIKINASPLVELVESGKFIYNKKLCKRKIRSILLEPFSKNNIDVATLSSTHLPFLLPLLKQLFPYVMFLDPAGSVSDQIVKLLNRKKSKTNTIKIFTSGNVRIFQKQLRKMGIKNKAMSL
jgi:glutamate racemase